MKDSEKKFTTCYTNLECKSCKKSIIRKFIQDDFVFKNCESCDECEGYLKIIKIFGETIG